MQNIDSILAYVINQLQYFNVQKQIFIQTGFANNKSIKLINVRTIIAEFSPLIINSLLGWYTFIGCKYEPCFHSRGKKSSFKILKQDSSIQEAFGKLGASLNVDLFVQKNIERYTCKLYKSSDDNVDRARSKMFTDTYKVATNNLKRSDLNKRNTDLKNLPPCFYVLSNKIKRANYLVYMMKQCTKNIIKFSDASKHGWKINTDHQYEIDFFSGPQYPELEEAESISIRNEFIDEDAESSIDELDYVSSDTDDEELDSDFNQGDLSDFE